MTKLRERLRLHPEFTDRIARYNIGVNEMTELAGLSYTTIYGLINPDISPTRKGGAMHRKTAWKIVNGFAEKTKMNPEAAWTLLIVESEEPAVQRPRRKSGDT